MKIFFKTFTFLFLFLFLFFFNKKTQAQSNRGIILDNLQIAKKPISKLFFEFGNVSKNSDLKGSFDVIHDQGSTPGEIKLKIKTLDFTQADNSVSPIFIDGNSLPESARASDWIKYENDIITLSKIGESKTVNFTIEVPSISDPGGKYIAILLERIEEVDNTDSKVSFNLKANIGTFVFFTVNGNVKKNLEIVDFYVTDIDSNRKNFFFDLPANLVVRIKNTGNTHVEPRGIVYLHNNENYTLKNITNFDFNPIKDFNGAIILPGATREFTFKWDDSFSKIIKLEDGKNKTAYDFNKLTKIRIGSFSFTSQINWIDENNKSTNLKTNTVVFFILPIYVILIIILFILFIISISYYFFRKKL